MVQKQHVDFTLKYWFPLCFTPTARSSFSFKSISQDSLDLWKDLMPQKLTLKKKKSFFFFGSVTNQNHTYNNHADCLQKAESRTHPFKVFESNFI